MRRVLYLLACGFVVSCLIATLVAQTSGTAPQSKPAVSSSGPTDPQAKKTYDEATKLMQQNRVVFALDGFRKADRQDGGHCIDCEIQAWKAAVQIGNFKAAREQAEALIAHVSSPGDKAVAQVLLGRACMAEGVRDKRDATIEAAEAAFSEASRLRPGSADYLFADGTALAYLKRDDAARQRFQEFLKIAGRDDMDYARAQRFSERPELARAKMAPNFRLTALDGRTLTLESLSGNVVLIDFWATWCGPCREALPHIRQIAKKFSGQPLVVLSISMDSDDARWKDFVSKNGMTWLQYRDGRFDGPIAKEFGVNAIPATFTIDADGVLEDQHVGDASIEGKLKKLIAGAAEAASHKTAPASKSTASSSSAGNPG